MISEERQHGDVLEHRHGQYEYWHPVTRMHNESNINELPLGHILTPVVPYTGNIEPPRGLQVRPFDWKSWDAGCHAKGICQGYQSILVQIYVPQNGSDPEPGKGVQQQLHHRTVAPDLQGIAEQYWQCPHCRQLQKPIQWAQGARLETYYVEVRGNRTLVWVEVSSGQWFVLVIGTPGTLQGVAMGIYRGTVYAVGNKPPLQLPDEIAVILARRMWHRLTKGYWSDRKEEEEEDC